MSDHSHQDDSSESAHEGPIKTPKQLITAVVFGFLVPIAVIVLLVNFVDADQRDAVGSKGLEPQSVAQRIQRVGQVKIDDPSIPKVLKTGEQVYATQCSTCHATGMANAPKFGDAGNWTPRIKTGYDALLRSALKGKGSMPAQGGGDFNDVEVARAVVHMANAAGAKFDEPKAPPPAATASSPAQTAAAAPSAPAVVIPAEAPKPAAAAMAEPPALYTASCAVCHAAGVAGAPKLGNKADWAPRLAQGVDGLTASAIKGKGGMPPKGGTQASDADLKAVVAFMVSSVK